MQDFPPALLVLSPRPVATGSPAGDALENLNTRFVADGAFCYVQATKSNYQLDLSSSAAANGTSVVAPIAGPGRWLRVSVSGNTFDSLNVLGNINFYTSQNGGWRDMIGQIYTPGTDIGDPVRQNIDGSGFHAYAFALGKSVNLVYHFQHDYALNTPVFLHAHWLTDGVSTDAVTWSYTWTYAKGFNQQNYNLAGTTVFTTQSPPGTAFRHMTSEIVVPLSSVDFEPDGILLLELLRDNNPAGPDNGDTVFLLTADCHYQANTIATLFRQPPFYSGSGP